MPFHCFFIIFAILCLTLMHRIRYIRRQEEAQKAEFWKQESIADTVRKQDISQLNYIHLPLERLPFGTDTSEEALTQEDTLLRLNNTDILNLNQYTNTEIKLQYGAANLPFLSDCDERFLVLVRTLYQWACILLDHGYTNEAICVAEYSIEIGSDLSGIYYMLTDYYKLLENTSSLQKLLEASQALTGINVPQIQSYIKAAQDELLS